MTKIHKQPKENPGRNPARIQSLQPYLIYKFVAANHLSTTKHRPNSRKSKGLTRWNDLASTIVTHSINRFATIVKIRTLFRTFGGYHTATLGDKRRR